MSPKHSIDFCPICGGGLCGIRICGVPPVESPALAKHQYETAHGMIVCDECEAIWLSPDVTTDHQYPNSEDASCPVCASSLWGENSRWADANDIEAIGWTAVVNPELNVNSEEGLA